MTYLLSTVHGSDKMSLSAIICGWILIKRALGIFICSFVDDFCKCRATGDFGGVGRRDGLHGNVRIPLYCNGNCDRRGWNLEGYESTLVHAKSLVGPSPQNFSNIVPSFPAYIFGEQGWCRGDSARLPFLWPGFDSWTWRHMWVESVVGSRLCSNGFSPGPSVLLPLQKSAFQISIQTQWNGEG